MMLMMENTLKVFIKLLEGGKIKLIRNLFDIIDLFNPFVKYLDILANTLTKVKKFEFSDGHLVIAMDDETSRMFSITLNRSSTSLKYQVDAQTINTSTILDILSMILYQVTMLNHSVNELNLHGFKYVIKKYMGFPILVESFMETIIGVASIQLNNNKTTNKIELCPNVVISCTNNTKIEINVNNIKVFDYDVFSSYKIDDRIGLKTACDAICSYVKTLPS